MKKYKIIILLLLLVLMLGFTSFAFATATISSVQVNDDNTELIITFSEAVSSSDAGQVALLKADLEFVISTANGSAAAITTWGTNTFTHEFPWTTVTADLVIAGSVMGVEEVEIDVVAASVYDTDDHSALVADGANEKNDYLNNRGKPLITSVVINLGNTQAVITFDKAVMANSDFWTTGTPTALTKVGAQLAAALAGGTATLTTWGTVTFNHPAPYNVITVDLVTALVADGLEVLTVNATGDATIYGADGTNMLAADTQIDNLHRKGAITMYVNNLTPLEYETVDGENPGANTQIYAYTAAATEIWVNDDLHANYQANDIIEVISGDGDKAYAEIARFDSDDGRHIYLSAAFTGGASTPLVGDELNFIDMTDTVNDDGPIASQPFKYLSTALANILDVTPADDYEDYNDGDIIIVADGTYDSGPYTVPHACTIKKAEATDKADYSNFSPVIKTTTTNNDIFDVVADIEVYFKGLTIMCNGTGKGIDIATWTAADATPGEGIITYRCYFYNAGALKAISGAGTDGTHKLPVTATLCWWNSQANGNEFTVAGAEALVDNTTNVNRTIGSIIGSHDAASGGEGPTCGEFESGDQGTEATFTMSDGVNSYDIKITPSAFPRTDDGSEQLITVDRWNICPPGREIYTPPYDAYYYDNAYFEITLGNATPWPDRKWEADAKVILATGMTNSHFADVQLMRYENNGYSFSGWVAVPGATLIDGAGGSDYLNFRINRDGLYCFVKPNDPTNNFGIYVGATTSGLGGAAEQPEYLLLPNADATWSWPLADNTYDPYDWDISVYESEVTFHISPTEAQKLSQMDMLVKWDGDVLQFQEFTWGTIFTAGNSQRYNDILGTNDGIRVSASINGFAAADNVESPAASEVDFFTLKFKYHKPEYTAIYVDYVDIRKFGSVDNTIDKRFSVPHDAAYINRLGDIRNTWDQTKGDGLVNSTDLALWTLSYWAGVSGSQISTTDYYKYKYDIGPTTNDWVDGWPIQDTKIEFEDLIIFGINYGFTTNGGMMVRNNPSIAPSIVFGDEVTTRSNIEIPVIVEGPVSDFRAGSFKIEYNHNILEFNGARKGSILTDIETTFMKSKEINGQIWCDFAVLGGDNEAINNPGELVILEFEKINEGDEYGLYFDDMKLRNSSNKDMFGNQDPEEPDIDIPSSYNLSNNFPNPFIGTTNIKYQIPKACNVNLCVFNIRGQKVATIVDDYKEVGYYTTDFNAHNLTNGIYFYRIQAGDFLKINKMLIIR